MFERHQGGDRAVLVQLDFGDGHAAADLDELKELARSAGADIRGVVTGRRQRPDAALYAGAGKVEEIAAECRTNDANLVIFNHPLSGAQERNLERALECRVVDRVTLILDIFALRAKSAEGKLQVNGTINRIYGWLILLLIIMTDTIQIMNYCLGWEQADRLFTVLNQRVGLIAASEGEQ
jgi:hypothetical protein